VTEPSRADGSDPPRVQALGPRCRDWALAQELLPAGSAGSYSGFLLVEQPLPWPAELSEVPELAGVAALAKEAGLRLQVVTSGEASTGAGRAPAGEGSQRGPERRIVCYRRDPPGPVAAAIGLERGQTGSGQTGSGAWAQPLGRHEASARAAEMAEAARALVEGEGPGLPAVHDVLVCTHGRRDVCCGSEGTALVRDLEALGPWDLSVPVRVWRTSHTGGHRFAPTVLHLPSATLWAWADRALVAGVLGGEGPVGEAVRRYRGCAVLGDAPLQALEAAVFQQVGWGLLQSRRRAEDLGGGLARLATELYGTWEAHVLEGRRVPQPDCRGLPQQATKYGTEWSVRELRCLRQPPGP